MRLFKKRSVWLPTWPLLLLLFVGGVLLAGFLFFASHDFLAVTKPAPEARVLFVESWMGDQSLAKVAEMINAPDSNYDAVWLAGSVLDSGSHLALGFDTFNEFAGATLAVLGVPESKIHIADAADTQRHRTYSAAAALKETLEKANAIPDYFDLVSLDVHARRSRLIYEKVFPDAEVGIIAIPPEGYTAENWYRTSAGMKNTSFELMAYFYERLGDSGR